MFGISVKVWLGVAGAALCALALVALMSPSAAPPAAASTAWQASAHRDRDPRDSGPLRRASRHADAPEMAVIDPPFDAAQLFDIGFAGGLRIDADTRSALEAVMNEIGDPPTEQDLQRIEYSLRKGLPTEDAEKTMALVRSYVAYVADVKAQLRPMGIPKTRQEATFMFDRMDALKVRHFDAATREALFGTHDLQARVSMQAMLVQGDAALGEEQKKAQLAALRAQLPPTVLAQGAAAASAAAPVAASAAASLAGSVAASAPAARPAGG